MYLCQITLRSKNNLRNSVKAHRIVCRVIQIHSLPQWSWAFLCTDGMNLWYFHIEPHTRHLKVYKENKISAQMLHPALVFPLKFNSHYERKQIICSLASGHVVVLQVTLLASWGWGGGDLLASNHTPVQRDPSKGLPYSGFSLCHPRASIMHPHASVLPEHGHVLCN